MRTLLTIGVLFGTNVAALAQSEMPKPAYDFSLPREERIKLAESAAPPEISSHATIYLLEPAGYVKIREGTNGFSCFVDRQTPLNLEPTCFDAEGSATTLPTRFLVKNSAPRAAPKPRSRLISKPATKRENTKRPANPASST
jgi:hypothetical protein